MEPEKDSFPVFGGVGYVGSLFDLQLNFFTPENFESLQPSGDATCDLH